MVTDVKVTASDEQGHHVTLLVEGLDGIADATRVQRHQTLARRLFQDWFGHAPTSDVGMCLPSTVSP